MSNRREVQDFGNCPVLSRIGEVEGTLTVAAVMPGGWGKRLGFSSIAITAAQKEPPAGREPRRAFPEVTDFGLRASCVSELAARDDLAKVELRAERDALEPHAHLGLAEPVNLSSRTYSMHTGYSTPAAL